MPSQLHSYIDVCASCYVFPFALRVEGAAAVSLFSEDYVEKVAGLMQKVTMPKYGAKWAGPDAGSFPPLDSGLS